MKRSHCYAYLNCCWLVTMTNDERLTVLTVNHV